ncbi:unnamed protein product, partial [Effrenium voratum]
MCHEVSEAFRFLGEMRQQQLQPNRVTYSALISCCEKSSQADEALRLFSEMRQLSMEMDIVVYNAVISACEKGRNPEMALHLLGMKGLVPNIITYNAVISACEKGRRLPEALEVFCQMQDRRTRADLCTYNALISTCEKCNRMESAMTILEQMQEAAVVPDLITFNACISACARASEAARAWALLRGLRRRALAPDAVSFTAALSAGPGGGAASALGVVEEMRRAQVRPNRLTCTALVSSLKESGLEVLQGMKRGGMEVDMVTYAAVLTSMERWQQWQEMPGMCEEMQQACLPRTCSHSAVTPDTFTLAATVGALGSGRWEQVSLLLRRLSTSGLEANVVVLGAVLSSFSRGGQWERSLGELTRLSCEGLQANVPAFNALLSSERGARAPWDQALELIRAMRKIGQPDEISYNAAASVCSLERRWEAALALLADAQEMRFQGLISCNIALNACEKVGLWRQALAFAAFSAVLDQHLATLRQALAEEHRRLRGEEPAAVEAPTFDHYFAPREEVANVQPTVPRAPPELADWPDEPEAPPDTPDVSPRSAFLLRRNLSAEKSAFKDPSRSRSSDIMKKVTFLEHIQLCEYPVPDTGEPLRALWKWPDENEPDQEEELMSEMQLPGGATGDVNLSRFDHTLRFFVMLPLSRRRLAWDTIALLILAIEVITFPLSTFEELEVVMTTNAAFMTMDWISAIYWLADMPLQLFAGYNTYEGKVEKRFSRTSWRYFKTWFFLDLIIVSLDWITLIGQYDGEFLETLRVGKSVRGVRILRGIRILRLAKLAPVIQHFSDSLKSDMALLMWKLTVVVLSALVMNHFIGCFWYWLGNITGQDGLPSWTKEAQMEQRGAAYQYVAALHWSLSNFAIATSRFHAVNELEHIFAIFVLLFGLICFASCLSAIAQAVSAYYAQESGVIQNEKTLRTFLGDRSISPQMCNRIWEFMRGRRRNRTRFTEQDVQLLQNLPKVLRVELRK